MLLVNQFTGFGILTFAKESRAIIDAMTVPPDMARRRLVDLTVRAFLGAALWPLIDVMWFMAAHDEQAGRLNWKDPATFTLSPINSPAFTTDRGHAGNGSSSYLDTLWDAVNNGVQHTLASSHISIYQLTAGASISPFGNDQSGVWRLSVGAKGTGATSSSAKINATTEIVGTTQGTLPYHLMARSNDGLTGSMVRDGVQHVAPVALSSPALVSSDLKFGKRQSSYTNALVAGGSLGGYLDDDQALLFYRIWNSYMRAVGADT